MKTNEVILRDLYMNVRACNAELKSPKLEKFLADARNGMSSVLKGEIDALTNILDKGR